MALKRETKSPVVAAIADRTTQSYGALINDHLQKKIIRLPSS